MKNILVVDNDKIFLKLMRRLLEKEGHQVETADDGLNALDILKTYTPDVILVDLVMPNIEGRTLCRIIRGMENFKNTPIIILSAISAEELTDFSQLEVNACIAKGTFNETAQHVISVLNQSDLASCRYMTEEVVGINAVYPRGITKELLSVKRHFEIMLDRMSEGVLEINLEGRIVYVNSAAFSLIDIPRKDLLGLYFVDLFSGDDRERVSALMKIEDAKSKSITYEAPVRLNKSQVTLNIIPLGEDENTSIIVLHNVTDRKQVEKALWESERKHKTLVHNIPGMVYRGYDDWSAEIISGSEEISDYSCTELNSKKENWLSIIHPDDKKSVFEEGSELAKRKRKIVQTYRIITKGGDIRWVEDRKTSLFNGEGKFVGIEGVVFDITERKKSEKALQESRDELERRVEERTKELEIKTKSLEELNTAMEVLLEKRKEDKTNLEASIITNVNELIIPYFDKIKTTKLDDQQKMFLEIIESNMNEIVSPFTRNLSLKYLKLTPTEIKIANMVKNGISTKEIAKILNISPRTVDAHRKNIRTKIGLKKKRANLRSHLLAMD